MEEFPSNSIEKDSPGRAEQKRESLKSVVSKGTVKRKNSVLRRVTSSFVAEDATDIKSYILLDVFVPAIKDMVVDAFQGGIERLFYGDKASPSRRNRHNTRTSYVSYNRMSDRRDPREDRYERPHRNTNRVEPLIFSERSDAEEVLDTLLELIENYGTASVADLNDLIGTSGDYTNGNWGWTNLSAARLYPRRGEYILELPRTVFLGRN